MAGPEAADDLIEFPCRYSRRRSGKLVREFLANLEMLIIHRIVPIAAPHEKTLIRKNAHDGFDHSSSLLLPRSIV